VSPALRFLVSLLPCLLGPVLAQAEDKKPDVLYITGQLTSIESADDGGGGGLEWLHRFTPTSGFNLGAYAFSFGGSQWAYGKVGGFFGHDDRIIVSGEVNLGAGEGPRESFIYQIYRAEVTYALIDKRFFLVGEDQYSHISNTKDNVIKAGLIFYPVPVLAMRLNYHISAGGNVDSRLVSGRVDFYAKRITLLAGFLVGRTSPEQLKLITDAPRTVDIQEFFAGFSLPMGPYEASLIFDVAEQSSVRKYSTTLVWKIPF
jgi:hypothetical protein